MNILKIVAVIAIIVAVIVAAVYLMGMFEQTKPYADAATGFGSSVIKNAQENPAVTAIVGLGTGGGLTAIGGIALSKINNIKQKATEVQTTANSKIDGLLAEKTQITDKLQGVETQFSDAKTQLSEMTQRTAEAEKLNEESATIVSGYKSEIERLKITNTELLDKLAHTPVNIVEVVK